MIAGLLTGGPDTSLRLWNHITPSRPKTILLGHSSGIASIFMQDGGAKIYSMDKNKVAMPTLGFAKLLNGTFFSI